MMHVFLTLDLYINDIIIVVHAFEIWVVCTNIGSLV